MIGAAKRKSSFLPGLAALRLVLLLVVTLCLPETRVWGFAAPPQPASGVFESASPSSVGEFTTAWQYDASDSLHAARGTANTLVHNGLEVRAVRDLSHVDDSTLAAMARKGFAPRTINGDKIVLHHHQQNPAGFIVEMPAPNHNIWNPRQHPFGNTPGAGLSAEQRAAFDVWRVDYWKTRAATELQRRAGQ